MINIQRCHISLLMFALMLVVTSLSFGQVRLMPDAVGNMVLCSRDGPETVLVDADGQPVQGSNICIDCITNFVSLGPESQIEPNIFITEFNDFVPAHTGFSQIKTPYDVPRSRAPPSLVPA